MVFVVERYLPGLSHSDLLRGLSRLEQATGARAVRYLGSTIVLGDEACFCQFEGPSEAAVAEANRKAGLPFDRIVPALTVTREGSTTMTVSPSIPSTVEMRRSRLLGLVAAVALVAAAITWALVARVIDTSSEGAQGSAQPRASVPSIGPSGEGYLKSFTSSSPRASVPSIGPSGEAYLESFTSSSSREKQYVEGVTSLTQVEKAAAYGGPGGVLDALGLGPREKQYVQGVTSLTLVERAAAFGGPGAVLAAEMATTQQGVASRR
jgi:Nickel responsive protein SCO4226-like